MTHWMAMAMWMAAAPAGWPMPQLVPADVQQAHSDYLRGDWPAFTQHVREALATHHSDPAAETNLLELLDAAFEARHGEALPVDFKLPAEIERLKVSVKRKESPRKGSLWFRMEIHAQSKKGSIENIRIERYPNQLVLDKQSGLGEWEVTPDEKGGDELWAGGECGPTPVPDGLYLITIKVLGQSEVNGWFALNHHSSSASPYFLAPGPSASTGGNPIFRWGDFRSPEHKLWEDRSSSLLIFDPAWNVNWGAWFDNAAAREISVGDKDADGPKVLKPGRYEAVLKFQERRKFGRLSVARDSAVAAWFDVVGP